MRQFDVINSWQFLCAASAPEHSQSGEEVLRPYDQTVFEELKRSLASIRVCMLEFVERRGRKALEETIEEEEDCNVGVDE
jgi:hypothetical protein